MSVENRKNNFLKRMSKKLFLEYLEKSCINGLLNIRKEYGVPIGGWLWIIFIVGIQFFTNYNIFVLIKSFMNSPTETNLSTNPVHIRHIPFPAIAVCGANRISRKALTAFATEVYNFDKDSERPYFKSFHEAIEETKRFSDFYSIYFNIQINNIGETDNFHQILILMHNTTNYPTRDILRRLSGVNCDEMIVTCSLKRRKRDCSKLFNARMTTFGVCCIYNYNRTRSDGRVKTNVGVPAYTKTAGQFSALTIGLKSNYSDFMVKDFPMDSYRIMVYRYLDYPDFSSESENAVFIEFNSETDISINPTIMIGSDEMKSFSPETRKCYFEDEGRNIIKQDYYSLEECLVKCQVESIQLHCGCAHPLWPHFANNTSFCGLNDLSCLAIWRWKWFKWDFFDYANRNPKEHEQNCPLCKPTCKNLRYTTDKTSYDMSPPRNGKYFTYGPLKNIKWESNLTLVRIYFQSTNSYPHTQRVSGNWMELLARFGGFCGMMYAFSFISIIEPLYFMTGKFFFIGWLHFKQRRKNYRNEDVITTDVLPRLYWNEIVYNAKYKTAKKRIFDEN